MNLSVRRRIAAKALKCGLDKVKFDSSSLDSIKDAITTFDIKQLIGQGKITKDQTNAQSRGRARQVRKQKSKGRQRGQGSRKGKSTARLGKKDVWMSRIRLQRKFIKELKEKSLIENSVYHNIYAKAKGGFFRSKNHIKLYLEEKKLFKK